MDGPQPPCAVSMTYVDSKFAHRDNRNGTFDSICRECFATIATAQWEASLEAAERAHVCDPEEAARFAEMHGFYSAPGVPPSQEPVPRRQRRTATSRRGISGPRAAL